MRAGIAAFAGGVILLYCVGEIPPWPIPVIALIMGFFLARRRSVLLRRAGVLLFGLSTGLTWAAWMSSDRLATRLPHALEPGTHLVEGYRCSLVAPGAYHSLRFDFCVTRWPEAVPGHPIAARRLRLALYGAEPSLALPRQLRLKVRLKVPHGSVNPAGFRYETWLFRHGFDATGSVRDWSPQRVPCGLGCHYHAWREQVAGILAGAFGRLDSYPLIEALLMGERRLLSADDWTVFRKTGTSHLIAISGLHIGLVGVFVGGLVGGLLRRWPGGPGARWRRRLVFGASLGACAVYALLAGFTVPTQRALVMVAVSGLVYMRGRQSGYWTAWLAALALVLLLDPFAPLDGGFWLSFGAVAGLILIFSTRLRPPGRIGTLLLAQLGVMAGLLPILMVLGLPFSVTGWLVNLVAIPLMSFLLLPGMFLLVPLGLLVPGSQPVVDRLLDWGLGGFMTGLGFIADRSPEGLALPASLAGLVGGMVLVMLFPVRWWTRAGLLLAAAGLLCGQVTAFAGPGRAANDAVTVPELWIWDVGQGLAVTYRDGNKVLQYDTGPGSPAGYTAVKEALLPGFRSTGIRDLNWLMISHGDADHASGLDELLAHIPVERQGSGEPRRVEQRAGPGARGTFSPCRKGGWLGASWIDVWQDAGAGPGNAASCVLRIRRNGYAIILPGDITEEQEHRWLRSHPPLSGLRRIVVAPHHGSRTSSSPDWVRQLAPELVVFSAGYRHPYGHPAPEVRRRYRAVGARTVNTATSGAVHVRLENDAPSLHVERADAPFWIESPPDQ
ncbi:DNA internalization-related competence protein ComEC/Rec2 [Marinobacter halodurans]|uniref:DNA internalization-related competence protein ComEC/Rec2 n=1 Tax=Marinobacter halodurans TaxID=2528979 RepID=UPI0024182581|nr:DNA internalization-related competence protein ComEC/Rec2 [Marinobacter halodurans]